jgi:drug/metabolite transporter (DMT)-like permease
VPSEGHGLRIAGISCGVAGMASIATGAYFYTRARSYSDKVSNQSTPNPSDASAGKNAETMQWVLYSAGGAALATGVLLYALGWPNEESHRPVAKFAPILGHGLAGLSAQGAF